MPTRSATDETAATGAAEQAARPTYTNHNGYLMPKGFPVDGFISGLTYQAQPNDLFIATYPKCGTTWMQHIVYLILNNGVPIQPDERLDQLFPHLEEVGAEYVALQTPIGSGGKSYRLIKTHLMYNMLASPPAKTIVVVRNPKDCVVSFFHHTRGFEKHYQFADGSFDTFFDLFIQGKVDFGDYFDMTKSWLDRRDDKDSMLVVTYERLCTHTRDVVLQVAEFLDPDVRVYPQQMLANNEAMLKQVLEHSSMKSMKENPLRWSSQRSHTPFVRKGSVGGWAELLRPEQAEQIDRRMKETFTYEQLEFLGSEFYF
jgi:hypothetical protein